MLNKMQEKMNERRKNNNNKGFTLMELIVVVAILGFLIAMLAPKYMNYTDKAMGTVAVADVRSIQATVSAFLMDTNLYPTEAEIKEQMGMTATGDKDIKVGVGLDHDMFTYTYGKGGLLITAVIDIGDSTIIFTVSGIGNDAKKDRVIAGIGSNYLVNRI